MDAYRRDFIKLSIIAAISLAITGCKDKEYEDNNILFPYQLSVSLDFGESLIESDTRKIFIAFNKSVDPRTLNGNIYLQDKTGSLIKTHSVKIDPEDTSYQTVILDLKSDFQL